MSTNQNLPAGFSITSIGGKRCTAVPKAPRATQETPTAPTAAPIVVSTEAPQTVESSAPSTQVQEDPIPIVAPSSSSTPVATPQPSFTRLVSTTPLAKVNPIPDTSALEPLTTAPASTTVLSDAQSGLATSPTAEGVNDNNGILMPSRTSTSVDSTAISTHTASVQPSTLPESASTDRGTKGAIAGGVVGSITLIIMIGLMFLFLRRRNNKKEKEPLLSPTSGSTATRRNFYEIDKDSVGPTKRTNRWKQEFTYRIGPYTEGWREAAAVIGASVRSRIGKDRGASPTVNLNRGNSQFMDGMMSQHSRNNSSVLSRQLERQTGREKLSNWWGSVRKKAYLGKKTQEVEPHDPFARGMSENQANSPPPPSFSQLVDMEQRDLDLEAERRRASLGISLDSTAPMPSHLNVDMAKNPFADPSNPFSDSNNAASNEPWRINSANRKSNPFADPSLLPPPEPTVRRSQTYLHSVRRSRGQSIDTERVPSSIAPSRDSYRDTFFSTFSNGRKGKGRSDPFDLERPELWRPPKQVQPPSSHQNGGRKGRTERAGSWSGSVARDSTATENMYPCPLQTNSQYNAQRHRRGESSIVSQYSSGVSSLGAWGDPGPDVGASGHSSLRGEATENGGSLRGGPGYTSNPVYSQTSPTFIQGSFAELRFQGDDSNDKIRDDKRGEYNESALSLESQSSRGGVGKAR